VGGALERADIRALPGNGQRSESDGNSKVWARFRAETGFAKRQRAGIVRPQDSSGAMRLLQEIKMFITPAYAQGTGGGSSDLLISLFPFILVFVIIYFLMIRPQQKRVKEHQAMINAVRRGDEIVTAGGIVGKVTKVSEGDEIQVEIAEGVRVRLVKGTITTVRSKTEPAPEAANSN
jgi:preprotein translocase subunit YajC